MRPRRKKSQRRAGAVAVETAVVLPVFLLVLFSILDVSLSLLQRNALSECARRGARTAIVRGDQASTPMGPKTWSGSGADNHPVAVAIRPLLVAMSPADVQIELTWSDGSNRAGKRVHVKLTHRRNSVVSGLLGHNPWQLSAVSTMRIVH